MRAQRQRLEVASWPIRLHFSQISLATFLQVMPFLSGTSGGVTLVTARLGDFVENKLDRGGADIKPVRTVRGGVNV